MQIPDDISALSAEPGPWATAYLDVDRTGESGAKEVDLRWQSLRADLAADGADQDTLSAMAEAVTQHSDVPGRHGRLIVARSGLVRLDRVLPHPPRRTSARWSALPHLMPFFAQAGPRIAHVLAVTDRTGADLYVVGADDALAATRGKHRTVAGGEQHEIRKVGRNTWDERQFQNRVENNWSANAHDVAREVVAQVQAVEAELVLVAGEARARSLLRHSLADLVPPSVEVVELTEGGRAAGASAEALDTAVEGALLRHLWRDRRQVLERLQQGVGRHDYGVLGIGPVLEVLRKAQVETLIISDDASSTATAWIGPDPLHLAETPDEIRAMGVAEPSRDRLDAALVRAVAATAAEIVVTPFAHRYLPDGLGAVLRYADLGTPA